MIYYGSKLATLPDDPTLSQIREAVEEHYELNPTHGAGCACLDRTLAIVRETVAPYAFDYKERLSASPRLREARRAMAYIFNRLTQWV